MRMDSKKMKNILQNRLEKADRKFSYDSKQDMLRIENMDSGKGITVSISGIIAKWELKSEQAIDEVVYYVEEGLNAMSHSIDTQEIGKNIFPVIRSTSFPTETSDGIPLVFDEHTAETRVYYALDSENTYRLIDEKWMNKEHIDRNRMKEIALFNVRSLSTDMKLDQVAGNSFYFLNKNDGYDASRILNDAYLRQMSQKMTGEMAVAVPHQDVLIIADVQNETGFDILAEMTMSFFASGKVPITALSFLYENGELEPIFILGKNNKK